MAAELSRVLNQTWRGHSAIRPRVVPRLVAEHLVAPGSGRDRTDRFHIEDPFLEDAAVSGQVTEKKLVTSVTDLHHSP